MHIYIMIVVAFITILCFLRKLGYGKYTLIYGVLLLPFIWFAMNMITEAITIDEWKYITSFKQLRSLERGSVNWVKGTYQYRVSEISSGTVCAAVSKLFPEINDYHLIMIYRYTHWYLFFLVALGIAYSWNHILPENRDGRAYRIINAAVISILTGAPLSCLLLKVCNYDAGCVYFGIAGISLLVLAEKKCSMKLAYSAVLVSIMSCLEKWGGLPYWCICVAGTGALVYRYKKSLLKTILTDIIAIGISGCICYLSLIYIRLLECKGIIDISIGIATFPLFFMAKMFFGFSDINLEDINYYDSMAIPWLLFVTVAIMLFSILLEVCRKIYLIGIKQKSFRKVLSVLVFLLFIGTIVACFVVVRGQYPFVEIPEGLYIAEEAMNGTTYFYNAKTALGYWMCVVFYGFATVVTNWPTVYLLFVFLAIYCAGKGSVAGKISVENIAGAYRNIENKKGLASEGYFLFLTGVLALLLPIMYVLAGDPPVPRYFGVSILLIPIIALYIIYCKNLSVIRNLKVIVVVYMIILFEMFLYIPNYSCFAPVWLWRSPEWKQSVRQGEWAVAEAMMWGEDLAVAGKRVMDLIGPQEDYGQYTLFANYGLHWIGNPGFHVVAMNRGIDALSFTEYDYYIFTKFRVYRGPEPEFFSIVEPIDTVEFNGEIAVWIYRGDTIREYTSCFE